MMGSTRSQAKRTGINRVQPEKKNQSEEKKKRKRKFSTLDSLNRFSAQIRTFPISPIVTKRSSAKDLPWCTVKDGFFSLFGQQTRPDRGSLWRGSLASPLLPIKHGRMNRESTVVGLVQMMSRERGLSAVHAIHQHQWTCSSEFWQLRQWDFFRFFPKHNKLGSTSYQSSMDIHKKKKTM